jgi:hypothetical protein
MADKNYRSYEEKKLQSITLGTVIPPDGSYADSVKVWRCVECAFVGGCVFGGREDCLDIGRESHDNTFYNLTLHSRGLYCVTLKGGSDRNLFENITVAEHGRVVDFELGNWHTFNFERSRDTVFVGPIRADDGKPVTYCYRFGCRPRFVGEGIHMKHLWWRSVGLTVYWWTKYVWHQMLKRPDKMGA